MENIEILREMFPGRAVLGKKEVARAIGIGESTLNRLLSENRVHDLPRFRRGGVGEKGRYLFPITAVAEWLDQAG